MSPKSAFWWMVDEKLSQNVVYATGSPLKVGSDNLGNFALHDFALTVDPPPLASLPLTLPLFELILTFSTVEASCFHL